MCIRDSPVYNPVPGRTWHTQITALECQPMCICVYPPLGRSNKNFVNNAQLQWNVAVSVRTCAAICTLDTKVDHRNHPCKMPQPITARADGNVF